MNTKRLFLAIPIDDKFRQLAQNFIEVQKLSNVRWIKEENWHVTSVFLGDFPAQSVNPLGDQLVQFFITQSAFKIEFDSFLYIPNLKRPRMIWGKFFENEFFEKLQKGVFRKLKEIYKKERIPFELKLHKKSIPHITLCRLKRDFKINEDLIDVVGTDISLSLKVNCCQLYESILKTQGAEYNLVKEFKLLL